MELELQFEHFAPEAAIRVAATEPRHAARRCWLAPAALATATAAVSCAATWHAGLLHSSRRLPAPPVPGRGGLRHVPARVDCSPPEHVVFDGTRIGGRLELGCWMSEREVGGLQGLVGMTQLEPEECAAQRGNSFLDCQFAPVGTPCTFDTKRCDPVGDVFRSGCSVFCHVGDHMLEVVDSNQSIYESDYGYEFDYEFNASTTPQTASSEPLSTFGLPVRGCSAVSPLEAVGSTWNSGQKVLRCRSLPGADGDVTLVTRVADRYCDTFLEWSPINETRDCREGGHANGLVCNMDATEATGEPGCAFSELEGKCPLFCKIAEEWTDGPQ